MILDSGPDVVLDSGKCFGYWDVFLDSGTCFWMGSVLESGKCFVLMSHRRNYTTQQKLRS